jgi:hypothetical protein
MIRSRLARLERLAANVAANCPGCMRIPGIVLLPGEELPADLTARCERCGRVHERQVIQFVVPGMPPGFAKELAQLD